MKIIRSIFLQLITAILVFAVSGFYLVPDESQKNVIIVKLILQGLRYSHFQSKTVNDELSKKIFDLYIKRLDQGKRFLLKADVDHLINYQFQLDNQFIDGEFYFFNISNELITKRVKEAESYYQEILSKPFEFNSDETAELDGDKLPYAANKEQLKEYWRLSLKYQVLVRLTEKLGEQEKNKKDSAETKTFKQLEEEARSKVLTQHKDWYHRLSQITRNDRLAQYINSIVNLWDPHTSYFPPKDKENFDIQMSGKFEGIGATLQEKDGYIKVAEIIPGSASWRQGILAQGDFILKVGQGDEEPIDVVDMRVDEVVKFIRGKKGTVVKLTVKKKDGNMQVIPITRDIVIIEETFAKTALIHSDKLNTDIAYIHLPKFYADFNNTGGRNCSQDIKKELLKIKKEKINGIIIDLRNNGGGSLQDVVDMAGLFIPKGPIVQVKSFQRGPQVYEDRDTSVYYRGPLLIMVNSFSASASEIMAAAMQDYGRAVILGSTSTFGKGTVQRFYNLDEFLRNGFGDSLKPLGSMMLTVQKFYRINGTTTQLKGVTPDLTLPDEYNEIKTGEKELEYPLEWDEINSLNYEKWTVKPDYEELKKRMQKRIASDVFFNSVDEKAKRLKSQQEKTSSTLMIEKFRKERKQNEDENKKLTEILKENPDLSLHSLKDDQNEIEADSTKRIRRETWFKNLKKDPYLMEGIAVVKDMIP